jgi:hypothetical protein
MSVISEIQEFWSQFEDLQDNLLKALAERNYETVSEIVQTLDTETYAISGAHFFIEDAADSPEMTFDTGPNKTSQLITQQMKELAPEDVKKRWIINDTIGPLSQKAIEASLQIKDEVYSLFDMTAFYQADEKAQSFSVRIYCPGFSLIENPEYKREMCIYLLELAIGEHMLEAYVSFIDFLDAPENGVSFCNLTELYEVMEEIIEKGNWKRYEHPLDIYTAFQPWQDFAHDSLRKDMKMIFTTHPTLIEESLGSGKDVLLDLKSREGEFGYIYYVNPFTGKDDALFRQQLSKKIEEFVKPLHCAKVIGGAIGKSYSYIDLIVFDAKVFEKVWSQIEGQLSDKVELHYRTFEQDV